MSNAKIYRPGLS